MHLTGEQVYPLKFLHGSGPTVYFILLQLTAAAALRLTANGQQNSGRHLSFQY